MAHLAGPCAPTSHVPLLNGSTPLRSKAITPLPPCRNVPVNDCICVRPTPPDEPYHVTEAALFARVKRRIWREDQLMLHRCSENSRWFQAQGRYYTVNMNNWVDDTHIDLEFYAREVGVLRADEALVEE